MNTQSPHTPIFNIDTFNIDFIIDYPGYAVSDTMDNAKQLHDTNILVTLSANTGILYMMDLRHIINNCSLYEKQNDFKCIDTCPNG